VNFLSVFSDNVIVLISELRAATVSKLSKFDPQIGITRFDIILNVLALNENFINYTHPG
jgi:hypothetical protein